MRWILVALLCAMAFGASAQERWRNIDGGARGVVAGALICPLDDAETANYFCFGLSCLAEAPLAFDILFAGGVLPDQIAGTLEVDGAPVATLTFDRQYPAIESEYRALYVPARHAEAIARLQSGSGATITITSGTTTLRHAMVLTGTRRGLAAVLNACPVAAPDTTPPSNTPRAALIAEAQADCAGGTVSVEPGFETMMDLDLDGRLDLVYDYGALRCSAYGLGFYCGSAGCTHRLFRALPGGGYDPVLSLNLYSLTPGPTLRIAAHGTFCGGIGADACTLEYRWVNGKPERVE